jgi:hypothetical protein
VLNQIFLRVRHWWLMPVILDTQEAKIRRMAIQSQPKANNLQDPNLKIPNTKQGWRTGSSGRVPV